MIQSLAVIGTGNMAKAIIRGITSSSREISLSRIYVYDIHPEQYQALLNDSVCEVKSIKEAVERADAVLLSVKPQQYQDVLNDVIKADGYDTKLYISIGAGISVDTVASALGGAPVVRVLPNVPMLIGMGVSVICRNPMVSADHYEFVKRIFCCAGSIFEIDESDMNRIIGVTSSSPAYVFQFIDAIFQGAIAQGLDANGLLPAICDMVIGSATMLKNGNDQPAELIAKVASKGGTTEQALRVLADEGFSDSVIRAMSACTKRADELGKING